MSDAAVVERQQDAWAFCASDVIANQRKIVVLIKPVSDVETGHGGVWIRHGGLVDANEGELIIEIPAIDIAPNNVAVQIREFVADYETGIELWDEGYSSHAEVLGDIETDIGDRKGAFSHPLVELKVGFSSFGCEIGVVHVVE